MSDYDNDLIEQMVRDGIRTRGGQHVGMRAHPSVTTHWECSRCMDQGCDFCNEVTVSDDAWMSLGEWREKPLFGDEDGDR